MVNRDFQVRNSPFDELHVYMQLDIVGGAGIPGQAGYPGAKGFPGQVGQPGTPGK